MKADILKSGMRALYYSGIYRLMAPYAQGKGLIFMLHQVNSVPVPDFAPNSILTVTPDFLDAVLEQVIAAGIDIVSLDEVHRRLTDRNDSRRFACFTLDDGYRDNLEEAYPVFQKHKAPFAIYVPSSYPEGKGELWWLALEKVIAENVSLQTHMDGVHETHECVSVEEKTNTFEKIYWWLRSISEDTQRTFIAGLCDQNGVDQAAMCRELIMSWDEIRSLNKDPLVTIGAHTLGHYAVGKLPQMRAQREIVKGAEHLKAQLGETPQHFSYPYGDEGSAGPRDFKMLKDLGFKTAVTTRKGVLFEEHATHLTALPRVSLNGAYQSLIYSQLYLSGAPFMLWNKFQKVNAA